MTGPIESTDDALNPDTISQPSVSASAEIEGSVLDPPTIQAKDMLGPDVLVIVGEPLASTPSEQVTAGSSPEVSDPGERAAESEEAVPVSESPTDPSLFDRERAKDPAESLENAHGDALADARRAFEPKYEIHGVLGKGAMGIVFDATHLALGRRVAIKVLGAGHEDPSVLQRFRREARVLARIRHAGVVEIDDFDALEDGRPFMIIERLVGEDLKSFLDREGRLHPALALQLGAQICDALAAAHAAEVIHRDLKPANVFVTHQGDRIQAKLIDFGTANIANASRLTQIGMVVGTPAYMAPEQVYGEDATPRTDIHAVGLIVYEMLTGQQPFHENKLAEVLISVASRIPSPLEPGLAGDETEALNETIQKALAKTPAERWGSAEEFGQMLTKHAASVRGEHKGGVWKLWPFGKKR